MSTTHPTPPRLFLSPLSLLFLTVMLILVILQNDAQSSSQINRSLVHMRNLVGGYSAMDVSTFQTDEIQAIADFSFEELGRSPTFDSVLVVSPEEIESGSVRMKVLEASRQVVAGMNYKLTLAILRDDTCVASLKTTVYKPLPSMEDNSLHLTGWGITGGCGGVSDLLQTVINLEEEEAEEVALEVEEGIVEEEAVVEPDA